MSTITSSEYRRDISCLRALAVLAVVLFHYKISGFDGGFVGVDVFFVISGYLMTKIITQKTTQKQFSFLDFYFRRAKRILPALLVVVLISYLCGFLLFSPQDFKDFSGSVLYSVFGLSNIYFWFGSGYFDTQAIIKPLLHTWSLSVEFQFYFLWPVFILAASKFGRKAIFAAVVTFAIISFYYSVTFLSKDSTQVYFLTPFRGYEFALGGMVVFLEGRLNKFRNNSYGYVTGLALVVLSIYYINDSMPFPGYYSLPPTIGAAMMIFFGTSTYSKKISSLKIIDYIGEISYSLYLVHWPVLVFFSYSFIEPPTATFIALMIALCFALAILLNLFVETPFRSPKINLSKSSYSLALTLTCLVITLPAASSWANAGWPWRVPESIRNLNAFNKDEAVKYIWKKEFSMLNKKQFDNDGKEKLLFIGDSQTADIINMMNESDSLEKYDTVVNLITYECGAPYVPVESYVDYSTRINTIMSGNPAFIKKCRNQMDQALNISNIKNADKIFIAMLWQDFSLPYLSDYISKIRNMTDAEIIIVGKKGLLKGSIDIINNYGKMVGINDYAKRFDNADVARINSILVNMTNTHKVKYFDMQSILCSDKSCSIINNNNEITLMDAVHLTKNGAKYFAKTFLERMNESGFL